MSESSVGIDSASWHVAYEAIQINSTVLLDWVFTQPASQRCAVVSVSVITQSGFFIVILRREAEGVFAGEVAGGAKRFAEGTILVIGGGVAGLGVDQANHVAVEVV